MLFPKIDKTYGKLVTVRSHPTHEGKCSYGRIRIEMDPSFIGKKAAVVMLMPPKEE